MAKPELGTKRTCLQCGERFYDLDRTSIVCPYCGNEHTAELFARNRRLRSTAADALPRPKRAAAPAASEATDDPVLDDEEEEEDEATEDFEDTADLAEDDEDVSEVIDTVNDDDDQDR